LEIGARRGCRSPLPSVGRRLPVVPASPPRRCYKAIDASESPSRVGGAVVSRPLGPHAAAAVCQSLWVSLGSKDRRRRRGHGDRSAEA
jgi:hypothetical protein